MQIKKIKILTWIGIILSLYLFSILTEWNKIIIGFIIFLLLLIDHILNEINSPPKTIYNKAANETFFDAIKWVMFGIFAIFYPIYMKTNNGYFLISVLIFVLILYGLNLLKEKF